MVRKLKIYVDIENNVAQFSFKDQESKIYQKDLDEVKDETIHEHENVLASKEYCVFPRAFVIRISPLLRQRVG